MARPEAIPSSAMKVTSINQETCRLDFSLKVERRNTRNYHRVLSYLDE